MSPKLAITIGDPAGIGPETALKALVPDRYRSAPFALVGPAVLWHHHAELLTKARPHFDEPLRDLMSRIEIVETQDPEDGAPLELGFTSERCGIIARAAIERAVEMCQSGEVAAMVTAPISKEGLRAAGGTHPGHTELLRDLCGVADTTMAFAGGGMHVALATIHVPLRSIFDLLTPELIIAKARHLKDFLLGLGISEPHIALAGLNPHASEGGMFGDEEEKILKPAIERASAEGIKLSGPYPGDTVFLDHRRGKFDAVLALYHDQGLIAVKTVAFDEAVNVTLGLPIVRTSPDHGTAFDIAGKGEANEKSFGAAIDLAIRLTK